MKATTPCRAFSAARASWKANGKVPGMGPGIAAGLVLPRDETGGEGFN